MEIPPLDDNTWTYYLDLPERIISRPTRLNLVPSRNAIIYDWNSKAFLIDSEQDSLFNVPEVDWNYVFNCYCGNPIANEKYFCNISYFNF